MQPCTECKLYKKDNCPYDYNIKLNKKKTTPQKVREGYIKRGYPDCFWTAKDVKEYLK